MSSENRLARTVSALAWIACAGCIVFWPDTANAQSVSVTANAANATEQGQNAGSFEITRTGSVVLPLTVNCTLTGTASINTDYTTLPVTACPVIIPASQTGTLLTIIPIDDTAPEGDETVTLTLTLGGSATVTIADNDIRVTVTPVDPSAAEQGPDAGTFRISRPVGSPAIPLTVQCNITGSAIRTSDYTTGPSMTACSPSVSIPATQNFVDVVITPVQDSALEGNETVILTVRAGSGYTLGAPSSATITIADDDLVITLTLASGGPIPGSLLPNQQLRLSIGIPASITPSASPLTGVLDVSLIPAPQGVQDPNMVFQNGLTSVNLSIPAGERQGMFVNASGQQFTGGPEGSVGFQPGTNAGTITFASTVLGTVTTNTTKVDLLKPRITNVTVEKNPTGMTVSVVGFSTTRNMTSATFMFTGPGLPAQSIALPAVATPFTTYFARRDAAALKGGSEFLLTTIFTVIDGTSDRFNAVTVTLTNSEGPSESFTISY